MRFLTVKLLAATALSLTLAACVPGAALDGATPGVAQAPIPTDNALHYMGVTDDGIAIPTVPVEKVPAEFQVQQVDFASDEAVGTIIINPAERHLYYINGKNTALRYGIAVGKAGFQWAGVANITSRTHWPKWTPPPEMIERHPELAKWEKGQPGGPTNPLGARALYLTTNGVDYGYRIHGTPEWFSIGKNASSGCIRMINQDVMDLYNRVQDGAKVVVLNADGTYPDKLKLPPPAPKKKKPAPVEAVSPVPSAIPTVLPGTTTLPAAPVDAMAPTTTLPADTMAPTTTAPADTMAPASTSPAATMAPDATTAPAETMAPVTAAPITAAPVAPAPATTAPVATAPAATVPAVTPEPAATAPAEPAVCSAPLVNGVCPQS
ncbi:MAG: L,D-transpeptidase [Cypionkella sp.]|uniref:L,D-transpeptidase n=1 Tax=Cypionkella sp. TaxID=2811411 RepID=UPI002621E003|nr:L,D-transpeptidase family protein [Cypionkella sp.]MDB5660599.1 L,D-transpeptidase [Cypionkella sp.]